MENIISLTPETIEAHKKAIETVKKVMAKYARAFNSVKMAMEKQWHEIKLGLL